MADRLPEVKAAGKTAHDTALSAYEVWVEAEPGLMPTVHIGTVGKYADRWGRTRAPHACWLVHDRDGNLLVSAAMGIGHGGCISRADALWVLAGKLRDDPELLERLRRRSREIPHERFDAMVSPSGE